MAAEYLTSPTVSLLQDLLVCVGSKASLRKSSQGVPGFHTLRGDTRCGVIAATLPTIRRFELPATEAARVARVQWLRVQ